jgi:hypothetical protein
VPLDTQTILGSVLKTTRLFTVKENLRLLGCGAEVVPSVFGSLVLAERAGIDRSVAYEVLAASAVGAPCVSYKRAECLYPESLPPVFSLEPAEKDLRLIGDLAPAVDPLRAQGSSPAAAASAKPVEPKSGGGT